MLRRNALAILIVLVMGGWLVWAFGASSPKAVNNEELFREATAAVGSDR